MTKRKKTSFILLFSAFAFLLLFLFFSFYVNNGHFVEIDIFVNHFFGEQFSKAFFLYSKVLEYLYILFIFLFFRLLTLFRKKREKMEALLLLLMGIFSLLAQFFVKPIFNILCPGSYYNSVFTTYRLLSNLELFKKVALNETCYPSNHTVAYVVVCGYLAVLLNYYFPKKKRINVLTLILLFIAFTVGFTRMYLHVHWFSDVIAGYLLGGFFLSVIFLVRFYRREIRVYLKDLYEKLEKNTRK